MLLHYAASKICALDSGDRTYIVAHTLISICMDSAVQLGIDVATFHESENSTVTNSRI